MTEADFIADLTRSLGRSQRLARFPLLIGAAIALLWVAMSRGINLWQPGILAGGMAATMALSWLQSRLIDQSYLPELARIRGITPELSGAALRARLPTGVVRTGTRQVVINAVSGHLEGQVWQAGFLECSQRDLRTGSSRTVFCGQLVQIGCNTAVSDFVLRPKHAHPKLNPMGWPKALEFTAAGQSWVLYARDAGETADLARRCADVLHALPPPPEPARLLGLICTQGWLQILCANRRDLFSLWPGLLPHNSAVHATQRACDGLFWAERAAHALSRFNIH